MNVLIICGSPRKGGNTEALLNIFRKELTKYNICTSFINLSNKKINHCLHCDKCNESNKCIQNDSFNSIYNKIIQHKGLVIGSPVYVGAPTSLVMALIQRLTYVSYNNKGTLSKKVGGPVAVAGETGHLTTINCLIDFYLVNQMIIPSSSYWNIGVGVNKDDILNDKKGILYMTKFAENMAWIMKKMKEEIK